MADESNPLPDERTFGHCIVTWEIKNYGRALWQRNWEVETPEFSIKGPKSQNTKWKLVVETESNHGTLHEKMAVNISSKTKKGGLDSLLKELGKACFEPKVGTDENENPTIKKSKENESAYPRVPVKNVMLHLIRAESDEGPSTVLVDWKVYYIGINGEKNSVDHNRHFFDNGFSYGINIGIIYDLEREFEYNSGIMTFLCDMIVNTDKDVDTHINFHEDVDIDLCGLSEDLQWIFGQQKFCDTKLKVGDKSIMVHKAVLCSHSNFFERSFREEGLEIIEMSDIKYNDMLKLIEYMYSYELKDIIGRPSISFYDSIIQMNLRGLAAHYVPEEQKIHTTIDTMKQTFSWIIKNFTAIEGIRISSPIFCNNVQDIAWQIHLYPKGIDGKNDNIALFVECIEGNICEGLCIQCAVLERNEKLNLWKSLGKSDEVGSVFEDKTFILREDLLKRLINDSLRIGLKVRMCAENVHSLVNIACTPDLYSVKKSLDNMANNMLTLRQNNKYTDVILKIGKEEIKAHRFLLSARSYLLANMLEETQDNVVLLSNVSPEILKILLDYMYCGILNVSDTEIIMDVYKAAEEFLISRLQDKCSQILKERLAVDTVIGILRLANEFDDEFLKAEAFQFLSLNGIAYKSKVLEDQKSEAHLPHNGNEAISEEEENKLLSSIQSKVKMITILKYDNVSILNVDSEIASKSIPEKNISTLRSNGTLYKNMGSNGIKNVPSDELPAGNLKQIQITEGEKAFPEMPKLIVQEKASPSKPRDGKLDVPLKKRYRNETYFPSNIEAEKEIQQTSQDNILNVQSQDEAIKEIQKSYSPNKNASKKDQYETSNITESDNEENKVSEFESPLKACSTKLNRPEELGAMPLDESNGNGREWGKASNKLCKEELDSTTALNELSGNESGSNSALDELNGNGMKSNMTLNEPGKKVLEESTALGEQLEQKIESTSVSEKSL